MLMTALILGAGAWSAGANAREVRLVIWVNDGESFSDEAFALHRDVWDQDPTLETRVLRTKRRTADRDLARLSGVFEEPDRVREIVIATHGATETNLNRTTLTGLGGFDQFGAFGGLRTIIGDLASAGRLSERLHVELSACSTFEGDGAAARARAEGLANYIRSCGVERISCWGARHVVWSAIYQKLSPRGRHLRALRDKALSLELLVLIAGIYHVHRYVNVDPSTTALSIAVLNVGVLLYNVVTFYDIWVANREGIDQIRGYLFTMTPSETTFEESGSVRLSADPAANCEDELSPAAPRVIR